MELQTGTLQYNYFENAGEVIVPAGTRLRVAGGGAATGSFEVAGGATLEWAGGEYRLESGAVLRGSGLHTNWTTLTVNTDVAMEHFGLAGTLSGTGSLTVSNVMNWTAGGMSGSGRTVIAPGAKLNMANGSGVDLTLSQWTLENGGTASWTGGGQLGCGNGAVLTNRAGALWEVRNDQAFSHSGGVGPRFHNAGTFRKTTATGTTLFTTGFSFNNYGLVELQTGTLQYNYFENAGEVIVPAGTRLRVAGGGAATGSFEVAGGATLEWAGGEYRLESGVVLRGSGLHTNWTTLTVNTDVAMEHFGLAGTLSGTGSLTVSNVMNWTAGGMSGSGRTVIAPGAKLNMANGSGVDLTLSQWTLENGGTASWTGGGQLGCGNGAVLTNRAGALWEVRNDQAFSHSGGVGPQFHNAGTFRKTTATGTTLFTTGFPFNNYGLVELQTGTLHCKGAFNHLGAALVIPTGAALRLACGGVASGTLTNQVGGLVEWLGDNLYTLQSVLQNDGAAKWAGSANLFLDGGTFNNNGSFTVDSASELEFTGSGGTSAFNNSGALIKQGAGEMRFSSSTTGVPFNSTGTVDVQAGTLAFDGGGGLTSPDFPCCKARSAPRCVCRSWI